MTAVINHIVFEEDKYILYQIKLVKESINKLKVNKYSRGKLNEV